MDELMNGWMDEQVDEWIKKWMIGWMNEKMYGWTYGWMDGLTNGWLNDNILRPYHPSTFSQSVNIPPVNWAPHSIKCPAKLNVSHDYHMILM